MYGGRVQNDWDRRVMLCYLEEYCGDFIFDTNQKFYFSRCGYDYIVPQLETLEEYHSSIEEIPLFTSPNVFGLHTNAEIIYYSNYANNLWMELLKMSATGGSAEGGGNRDEYIRGVASEI